MALSPAAREVRERLVREFEFYAANALWIRTKDHKVCAVSFPQLDVGSGRPASGALRHPELADCRDHQGNVVIGVSQELFAFRTGPHLSEQRTPGFGTVDQNGEQKPVFDPAEIAERMPGVVAEFHRGQEPHAPGARQDRTFVGALKDRGVLLRCRGQTPR